MQFVNEGHLGGYVAADAQYPNGDPKTFTPKVWTYLVDRFDPFCWILDVGCGEGHALKWMKTYQTTPKKSPTPSTFLLGIDGSETADKNSVLPPECFMLHDFTKGPVRKEFPEMPGTKMIWSCEFVEHVEEQYLQNVLSLFSRANVIAMTHAFPGQLGHHHVNCQETGYWMEKMRSIGFALDAKTTEDSRRLGNHSHWKRSGLVFTSQKYTQARW